MMLDERDERLRHGYTYLDGTANQAIQDVVRPTEAGARLEEAPDEERCGLLSVRMQLQERVQGTAYRTREDLSQLVLRARR